MIYHDRLDYVRKERTDQVGDPTGEYTIYGENVPAEVQPIGSREQLVAGGEVVTTRYLVTCALDFVAAGVPSNAQIGYRGKRLQLEGGFERHVILGRFHHTEFVVQAFG